jgi:FSR family fosmidomycin resistance protein-like MFS transporter
VTQTRSRPAAEALCLGGAHAAVDLACAFVLFRDLDAHGVAPATVAAWIVTYNALAFAAQVPLGLAADRMRAYRAMSLVGVAAVLAALWLGPVASRPAAALAGLGNSLFHVGAGAHVLRSSGTRATEIGLVVGPGAIGLSLGLSLGHGALSCRAAVTAALPAAGVVVAWVFAGSAAEDAAPSRRCGDVSGRTTWLCVALLLVAVSLRSAIGDNVAAAWRTQSEVILIALAAAATIGKLLGGAAADRLGWARTGGFALALAAPILAFGPSDAVAALVGTLLLQSTTPVTVKAVHTVMPDRPGLAFGMASAALLLGSVPGLLGVWMYPAWSALAAATLLAAGAVVGGLLLRPPRAEIAGRGIRAKAGGILHDRTAGRV